MNDGQGTKSGKAKAPPGLNPSDEDATGLLSKVRLLSLDVDGVMTDGGLYYADDGRISRKYNVKDGVGIKRVMEAGVHVAIISAGISGSVPERAETLGIEHVFTGVEDKRAVLEILCRDLGNGLDETAHIGDDLNDVALMEAVGCPIAVADAQPEALSEAAIVTTRKGGDGAIREICDALIRARTAGPVS
jgi:3-deoxy-D-manno-octulosonate 8-phosphate phosphatase (KDO 8-P phosphatase)